MSQAKPTEIPAIKWWKVLLAVGFSIGISAYFIARSFHPETLSGISLSAHLCIGLVLALLTVVVRDLAFVYKLRLSSGIQLGWWQTIKIVLMWEFGATVTPKLGEVAFVLYVLKRGGLTYGRSTAVLMLNAFFDNLAFVILFTGAYLILGEQMFMVPSDCADLRGQEYLSSITNLAKGAWIGYFAMLGISIFMFVSVFFLPHRARQLFQYLSSTRLLSRFKNGLYTLGYEIETTSLEYHNKPFGFWAQMTVATLINWSARYLLANALLFAFSSAPLPMGEVFARQLIIWVFLIIPSTPGASGVAEVLFLSFNCQFMPVGLAAGITTVWRIYSYYIYLIIGAILLPRFIAGRNKNQ